MLISYVIILGRKSTWSYVMNEEEGFQIKKLHIKNENCFKSEFEKFKMPLREVLNKKTRIISFEKSNQLSK